MDANLGRIFRLVILAVIDLWRFQKRNNYVKRLLQVLRFFPRSVSGTEDVAAKLTYCLHGTTSDLPWGYPLKSVALHRDTLHPQDCTTLLLPS